MCGASASEPGVLQGECRGAQTFSWRDYDDLSQRTISSAP
jgi:hypothetical protein